MDQTKLSLIVNEVQKFLQQQEYFPGTELDAIRLCLKNGETLDYEYCALPFAQAFWERNFWKAAYFFCYEYGDPPLLSSRFFRSDSVLEIVVLGVGSAADAVACLAWLDHYLPLQRVALTLIDRSQRQLDLARNIISVASLFLNQVEFDVRYACLDIQAWQPGDDSADLIIVSHVLTENPDGLTSLMSKLVAALRPRGDLLIIERQRDPIWQTMKKRLALGGVTTHDVGLNGEKFSLLAPVVPVEEMDITPSYVRGNMPEQKSLQRLVAKYFEAWVDQAPDLLSEVFTTDATYDEKPGIEPVIEGLDGIRSYWERHPVCQRNIELEVHNVAYGPTAAVCSFGGKFDTPKQRIKIQGAINFFLDPYRGKIHRLTEYFGTVKTPYKQA